jgi:hypothetical protein
MHHPTESDLALYAGNDLPRLARLRVDWHLRTCGKCQQEVTEFSAQRVETARNAREPEVKWDRLAAEMKANIRLGLQAGECIAPVRSREPIRTSWSWAVLATAALVAIAAGGEAWLHHSGAEHQLSSAGTDSAALASETADGIVLEVKDSGIQMRNGGSVTGELRTNNREGSSVVYSVNTQGGVGARYVDRDTGYVTVNNIYYGQ